jgi:hypothetical protein
MFDVQVISHRGGELPDAVVASIAGYYRRVTTEAGRMSRLVALVMVVTVAGIVVQIARSDGAPAAGWLSLVLAVVPIGVAACSTVPRAVRLGARRDALAVQAAARSICAQHVFCFGSIGALLVVQLVWMR